MTESLNGGHTAAVPDRMPTLRNLDELSDLVAGSPRQDELYVRWSRGPQIDLASEGQAGGLSRDALTGVPLPGLSANPLSVESWWGDRPLRLWVARRLYDYRHVRDLRGPGVRPWVLVGRQCGRGPDNEPLVRCLRPVAWISDLALKEAQELVEALGSREWGPLDRRRPG
jgi:hypothetical protein